MATNKDVKLTLSIDTLGGEQINKLQQSLVDLAKNGGDAAPEFQKLADEVGRLGEQTKAVTALRSLTDELDKVGAKQAEVAQRSTEQAQRISELRSATESAKAAQGGLRDEIAQQQSALAASAIALRELKDQYAVNERKSDEYKQAVQRERDIQREASAALIEKKRQLLDANEAVTKAVAEQKNAESAYARTEKTLTALNTTLAEQSAEVKEVAAAAQKLGVETENIAQAEGTLLSALNKTGSAAEKKRADLEAAARSEAELAESDRLLAIQEQSLAELYARSEVALKAEEAAQRAAAQSAAAYAAAKAKAAADAAQWQQEAERIVEAAHAAQRLERETRLLVEIERELKAQKVFEQQAAEARKMLEAANYVKFWERELANGEAAVGSLQAAVAALDVKSAFGIVGRRSVEELTAEIQRTRAAVQLLKQNAESTGQSLSGAFASGEQKIKELERELRELNGTLTTGDKLSKLFANSMGQITAGNLVADGVGYLVNKVKELGAAFVTTLVETDKLRRGLNAVYKDTSTTASQMDFLRKTALASGVSMASLQTDFVRFSAATKSANLPLGVTNDLFYALTRASGALGLGGEQVSGMLNALGQMASKGNVQMEELRGQLGDRLPGALSLAAQGLGITEQQLNKLVEAGGLTFRDFAPALTKALQQMSGETDGLSSSWENLKTALTTTAQTAGDAGWTDVLSGGLRALTFAASALVLPLNAIFEIFFGLGRAAGVLAGAIATLSNPMGELARLVDEAASRQAKLQNTFEGSIGWTERSSTALKQNGVALQNTAQTAALASTALSDFGKNTTTTAQAQEILTAANGKQGATLVQLQAALSAAGKELEAQTMAAEKNAKAIREQGAATVELAKLSGDKVALLQAEMQAASDNAAANELVSEKRRTAVALLVAERDAMIRQAQSEADGMKAREAAIAALQQKIDTGKAELAQAEASGRAAQAEVVQRRLAIETYGDQSKAVDALKAAYESANAAVQVSKTLLELGSISQEDYKARQVAATEAAARYRDALDDVAQGIRAKATLEQAGIGVEQATLTVRQQAYDALGKQASASAALWKELGYLEYATSQERQATEYQIQAKKVQIEITKLTAQAKAKEAQAAILAAEADLKLLEQTDAGNTVKRMEIEARMLNAKAKAIEAGASAQVIEGLQKEIDNMQLRQTLASRNAESTSSMASATRDSAAASRDNAAAIERENDALRAKNQLTADNFKKNDSGAAAGTFNNSLPVNTAYTVVEKMNQGRLTGNDLADAEAAVTQAKNARDWLSALPIGSASSSAFNSADALVANTQRALEEARAKKKSEDAANGGSSLTSDQQKKVTEIQRQIQSTNNQKSISDSNYSAQVAAIDAQMAEAYRVGNMLAKTQLELQKRQLEAQKAQTDSAFQNDLSGLNSQLSSSYSVWGATASDKAAAEAALVASVQSQNSATVSSTESGTILRTLADQQVALTRLSTMLVGGTNTNGAKTVNINFGGKTTQIQTSNLASADALVSFLRELESASGTAS